MAAIGQDIAKAKAILEEGGLVAVPTETVYGLGGNALDPRTVGKIFLAKNRPAFDPLIVHTSSLERIAAFASDIPKMAVKLVETFWPGPLTILLKKTGEVPDLTTSGLDTVAVRIPAHDLTKKLLEQLEFPLAAPSANPFGYVSPTTAQHVQSQLGNKIDYILDGGECEVGIESTIVSFEHTTPRVLRLGGLSVEDIEDVIGSVDVNIHSSSKPDAPGMLKNHYAPKKTIVLKDDFYEASLTDYSQIGEMTFGKGMEQIPIENRYQLSEKEDLDEAAHNFFSGLRNLDQNQNIHTIIVNYVPNIGLGRAINDRIKRATAKS